MEEVIVIRCESICSKNCYVDEDKRGDARADLVGGCTPEMKPCSSYLILNLVYLTRYAIVVCPPPPPPLRKIFNPPLGAGREGDERARGGKKE